MVNRLNNINLLNREQYNGIPEPSENELWAVETPVVVETYRNGTSWYRIYSDGWIEQGGLVPLSTGTVHLMIEMTNADYQVLISPISVSTAASPGGNTTWNAIGANTQTSSTFTVSSLSTLKRVWEAKGYKA